MPGEAAAVSAVATLLTKVFGFVVEPNSLAKMKKARKGDRLLFQSQELRPEEGQSLWERGVVRDEARAMGSGSI